MRRITLLLALSSTFWSACDGNRFDDPPLAVGTELKRFDDCKAMKSYVADAWIEQIVQSRYGNNWYFGLDGAAESDDTSSDSSSDAPTDYSTTNTQEAGVDEPDIVKTDGNFVYVVQNSRPELTIVKSWPAEEAEVVGRVELDDGEYSWPYSMFLDGDRVVVFSYVYDYGSTESIYRDGYATRISLVDVSDRANPVVEREIDVEGWMADSRKIDSEVYLVLNTSQWMPYDLWEKVWDDSLGLPEPEYEADEDRQAELRAEARKILRPIVEKELRNTPTEKLLPQMFDHDPGAEVEGEPLLDCSDVYHPEGVSAPNVLSVVHLDLDDGDLDATGLMANGWTIYASEHNLYVAESSWWWWWGWGDLDMETHLHKFSLGGGAPSYEASASVPGWLAESFNMSEYEGNLRVATSDFDWWWGSGITEDEAANNVFVLDGDLNRIGEIRGIEPGERITATRFLGNRGYLVTFLWVDPLISLDLSDPRNPRVTGELVLPGFSTYLHPYDDGNELLAVGMDATEEGQITGLSVSLFDVSDPASPSLVARRTVNSDDWSWSEALWDHHAFTLHRDVLSLPIYTYDYDEYSGDWDGFSGMWSIAVTPEGLTEIGRVDHEDLVLESECLYAYDGWEDSAGCSSNYWYAWMRRSVVIEDNLFSISDYGIKVTDLNNPAEERASVLFWPAN